MNNHKQKLSRYVELLVALFGKHTENGYSLSLESIPDAEISKLIFYKLESNERNLESVFFQQDKSSDDDNCIAAFMKMLCKNDKDSQSNFIETILSNALETYGSELQQMIDEACADIDASDYRQHGNMSYRQRQTGENTWVRL